eukprot:854566-Amorphochlora_amoeboformis.AAC.1
MIIKQFSEGSKSAGVTVLLRVIASVSSSQDSPEILIRASNGRQYGYFGKYTGVSGEGWGR